MTDIWRDPIWQFIGALLALVAIIVSLYLFFLQRRKKKLSYRVLAQTALLSVNEEIQGKLRITYNKVRVQNVHLLLLEIVNNGNVSIVSTDYEELLAVNLGKGCSLLSAEIVNTTPKSLKPQLAVEGNRVVVKPLLLNVKDSFTIKFLLAEYGGEFAMDGRIVGVKEIGEANNTFGINMVFVVLGTVVVSLVFFFINNNELFLDPPKSPDSPFWNQITANLLGTLMAVPLVIILTNLIEKFLSKTLNKE